MLPDVVKRFFFFPFYDIYKGGQNAVTNIKSDFSTFQGKLAFALKLLVTLSVLFVLFKIINNIKR